MQNDSVGNVIAVSYDALNRVLNKNSTIPLSPNESNQALILIEHNYTLSGVYDINASINSSINPDYKERGVQVE